MMEVAQDQDRAVGGLAREMREDGIRGAILDRKALLAFAQTQKQTEQKRAARDGRRREDDGADA